MKHVWASDYPLFDVTQRERHVKRHGPGLLGNSPSSRAFQRTAAAERRISLPILAIRPTGLLEFRVLRLRLLVDGDVWVGIFPECKEVLVRRFRFTVVALHHVRAPELQACQRAN